MTSPARPTRNLPALSAEAENALATMPAGATLTRGINTQAGAGQPGWDECLASIPAMSVRNPTRPAAPLRAQAPGGTPITGTFEAHSGAPPSDSAGASAAGTAHIDQSPLSSHELMSTYEADFLLREVIGRGGQAEVWRAWQTSLSREVAVKRLTQGSVQEFLREAYTTAHLDHPNIVPVHELGRVVAGQQEEPLLAMKIVRGKPWNDLLKTERQASDLNFEDFLTRHLEILVQVCHAVAFAHSRGIVHRDLKPSQVMVGAFGEVYLMDWGLAICVEPGVPMVPRVGIARHTPKAQAVNQCGSPAYMAPEQTEAQPGNLGYHTDIYLLGAILYEILTGAPPHQNPSAHGAFMMAALNEFEPLPETLPEALRTLCIQALETEPRQRPASVADFQQGLRDFLTGAGNRRLSVEIFAEVRAELSELERSRKTGFDYRELSALEARLARALRLWPDNHDASQLRQRILELHADRAISAGDLQLADSLLRQLDRALPSVSELWQKLEGEHARRRRAACVMRGMQAGLAVLLVALLAGGYWHIRQQRIHIAQQEVAAASLTDQRNRAQNLLNNLLFNLQRDLEPIGRLDLLETVALGALEYYSGLPREDDSPESMRTRGVVFHRIGRIFGFQGKLREAAAAYQRFHDIMTDLVTEYPEVMIFRNDLAHSHIALGDLAAWSGRVAQARSHYAEALRLNEALFRRQPSNLTWGGSLAASLFRLADADFISGNLDAAEEGYRTAAALWHELAQLNPGDIAPIRDHLVAREMVATLDILRGRLDDARATLHDVLRARRELLEASPGNARWIDGVVAALLGLGILDLYERPPAEALAPMAEAEALARQRYAEDPRNDRVRRSLSGVLRVQAHSLVGLGRATEALARAAEARDLLPLNRNEELSTGWVLESVWVFNKLAEAYEALGQLDEAAKMAAEALKKIDERLDLTPDHAQILTSRTEVLVDVMRIAHARGDDTEAARAAQAILEIAERLEGRVLFPGLEANHAWALLGLGRAPEAEPIIARLEARGWLEAEPLRQAIGRIHPTP